MSKINVVKEFTDTPGGRTPEDGPFSGQEFLELFLLPRFLESIEKKEKLLIELDGGYGYGSSFLEEAFGGLTKLIYNKCPQIWENLIIISNDDLSKLKESINVNGVLEPIIVRKKDDRYEIISGHCRKYASELLGLKTIPCIIRDMTDDEATIYMVDSNMHRETILPSEKAKAYKMKLDALNH